MAVGNGYSNSSESVITQGANKSMNQFIDMYDAMEDMAIYDNVHDIIVDGRGLTAVNLKNAIQRAGVRPGIDDLTFVFIGHGGAGTNGRFYNLADGTNVWKKQVDDAFIEKNARLTVLFNESCAHLSSMRMSYVDDEDETFVERLTPPDFNYDNLRRLFEMKGVINFSSSSIGQYSWLLNSGGIASTSLVDVLTGRKNLYSWSEVVRELETAIENKFRLYLAQGVMSEEEIGGEEGIQVPEINVDTTTEDDNIEDSDNPSTGNTSADDVSEDDFIDWD
jgi:hypothetical protein